MSLLRDLRRQRGLLARCPTCDGAFRLARAGLFDATQALPARALEYLAEQRDQLALQRAELRERRAGAKTRSRITTESVTIGKVVEQIAPSLPGFPARAGDCRSLFEPIDYIVFRGISTRGRVEALTFIDVKSGKARLSAMQAQVKAAVERGKVALRVTTPGRGGAR